MSNGWNDSIKADLDELFGSGTSVSGDSRDGGGTLWSTYYDGCEKDIQQIDDMRVRCWPDPIDADKAIQWVKDTRTDAAALYSSCLGTWNGGGGFAKDLDLITGMDDNEERWGDYLWKPIRHDGQDTADNTKVLKSWTGPGAEAYAQVLHKQTTAMAEFANLAKTSEGWMTQINNAAKGVGLGAKNYVEGFNSAIAEVQDSDEYVGIRASVGYYNFGYLKDWLSQLESDGGWKDSLDDLDVTIEDALRETSFKEDKWPAAKADDIQDMTNGNSGLGDKQPDLPQAPNNEQPQQDATPEQGGDTDTHGTDERDGTKEFNK